MARAMRRWKSAAIIAGLAVFWLGAVLAAGWCDEPLMQWLNGPGPLGGPSLREQLAPVFQGILDAAVFLTVAAILLSFPNRRRLIAGWLGTILLSAALTRVMKIAIGRARPRVELGPETFDPLTFASGMHSFPSGHTSSAVAMAGLLSLYFPRARIVFWFLALIVGLERIRTGAHFLSDVIAGAGVGVLSVYLAYKLLGRRFFELGRPDDVEFGARSDR